MTSHEQLQDLAEKHAHVIGPDGEKIGSLGRIFVDEATRQPSFVTVRWGILGTGERVVPVEDAKISNERLQVTYTKNVVKGAPKVDLREPLTATAERELYSYYAQPRATKDETSQPSRHVGPLTTATGSGTPLIAEEFIRQDGGVPHDLRTPRLDDEADPGLQAPHNPASGGGKDKPESPPW